MNNFKAEMARHGVTLRDIQLTIDCCEKTARSKVNGETEFTVSEALKIAREHFPTVRIEYLYAD